MLDSVGAQLVFCVKNEPPPIVVAKLFDREISTLYLVAPGIASQENRAPVDVRSVLGFVGSGMVCV